MAQRSNHQDRIIRNYYQNRDALMLQKLGELVGELYLAEGKARAGAWKRVAAALKNLKLPAAQIEHFVSSDNPALVARWLEEALKKS